MPKTKEIPIDKDEQKKLVDQFELEYQLCYKKTQSKRATALKRLKLYNNQKRDQSKVGDPLLFAIFNTVLAALYNDRLSVRWEGKEDGDDEIAENLTAMAKHDYLLMEKDELDYDWIWDTGFFGEGHILLSDFDKKAIVPIAESIDPMCFIKDPRCESINGNQRGFGAAKFLGREICLAKYEMEAANKDLKTPVYFNIDGTKLKKDKDVKDLSDEAKQQRAEAQGKDSSLIDEEALTENYEYKLIQWFTHIKGKKYLLTFANNRQTLIRYQELDNDKWPVLERRLFPMSHGDVVSIPDLIEDKQRARSVMINLGMESAKADLYPMYLFDKSKITNPRDLDFDFNKFVPIKGDVDKAVRPIQKSVFHQQVNLILNLLDMSAQKAVASPDVAQGVQPKEDRTLGETEMVVGGKNLRHSLAAKIFGWSEKRFWRQWYWLYKKYLINKIDEKIIRLQGPLSPFRRKLTRENLIAKIDPDVFVESESISEYNQDKEFAKFSSFAQLVIQDPETNRRYIFRKLGRINGRTTQELALMFPASIDEMRAEDENQKIADNKLPMVNAMDDDIIHIEIHNKATDTGAKLAHIEAHKRMLMAKKENPEIFPQESPMDVQPVELPKAGGAGSNRREATTRGQQGQQGGEKSQPAEVSA